VSPVVVVVVVVVVVLVALQLANSSAAGRHTAGSRTPPATLFKEEIKLDIRIVDTALSE
jgi:hypothetical protein